jgi:putative PIN family toxin of toxin-antitoxin system
VAKLRVILDCNIYVSSFISPKGIAQKILGLAESGQIEIWVSDYTIEELTDVLARPEFSEMFPHFGPENLKIFLSRIRTFARYARDIEHCFVLSRDVKDSHYIDLAVGVEADFIVTTDRDLLDLMTGADMESKEFRQRFRGIKIVKPEEILSVVAEIDLALKP